VVTPGCWSTLSFERSKMAQRQKHCARYPTATLADIYAVIAYYLRHRDEIDALSRCSGAPARSPQRIHTTRDLTDSGVVLLARASIAIVEADVWCGSV